MDRTLVFSLGSPFARKIRIVLAEKQLAYAEDIRPGFREVEELRALTPTLMLPVLIDGGETIFESNLIIRYLLTRYAETAPVADPRPLAPQMTRAGRELADEKILAVIETFANTMVNVRHVLADSPEASYMRRQQSRLATCLDWLEAELTDDGFWPGTLSAMDINLVCPLDYALKRNVYDWRGRPKIDALHARLSERASFLATAIPQ
ncbi:glutathione S-transferase family protein [Chthonobacter albigriseus]|uniref:glutathione S-transferase family protein n=1 Tax=Chthonobacter albigriseus TaxID=1683161 RepID=UPI0015EFCFAB|nr:glutathione S-transferase family protein [Chthonobacter albigriseus]